MSPGQTGMLFKMPTEKIDEFFRARFSNIKHGSGEYPDTVVYLVQKGDRDWRIVYAGKLAREKFPDGVLG